MNTYQIGRNRSYANLDEQLVAQFEKLQSQLRWRPLTANLESCEDGRYLYFRICLRLTGGTTTYAGFPSGAPFMLNRECREKKKGFFLRHWVRHEAGAVENNKFPLFKSPHLQLAVVKDTMIVRVDIDREMTLTDTFKSVPFATWMFQVVQMDALIPKVPGLRFAFAIERTVTADERAVISRNAEHVGRQTRIAKIVQKSGNMSVAPVRIPPPNLAESKAKPIIATTAKKAPPAPVAIKPQKLQPPTAQSNGIVARTLVHRNAVTMSAAPSNAAHKAAASAPSKPRNTTARQNTTTTTMPSSVAEKKVFHPYLRLWENRPLDDPYEPLFVVNRDEASAQKLNHVWQVEDTSNASLNFHYKLLGATPGADFAQYFVDTRSASHHAKVGQDVYVVHPMKKARLNEDRDGRSGGSKEEKEKGKDDEDGFTKRYIAAVKAAGEYNANLEPVRIEHQRWVAKDGRVSQGAASKGEDEDSSHSD